MIKEVTRYITSDGTEFYNENEANKYELNSLCNDLTSNDLVIIDCDNHYYSPFTDILKGVEAATIIKIKTEKGLNALREASDYLGIVVPDSKGIFCYEDDEWINLNDKLKALNDKWQGVIEFEYKEK